MFKYVLAASACAGVMAHKPAFATRAVVHKTTHHKTVTVHHVKDHKLSAAFHKSNVEWARRQVDQWNHHAEVKHQHKGVHVTGYKWVKKSYWTKSTAIIEHAHKTYETCKANFHRRNGHVDVNAWKNSQARVKARATLNAELERARQIKNGGKGTMTEAYRLAHHMKRRMLGQANSAVDAARRNIDDVNKSTGHQLVHYMNKAQRMKARAIAQARAEKAAAEHKLHEAKRAADKVVKNAAWKAKQARLRAIALKDKMKAKAKAAARKAHKIKLALLAKAKEAKHELKAHARRVERRALLKERQARIAEMRKERLRIIAKRRAAAQKRRLAARRYRREKRKLRHDARRYRRDMRREQRLKARVHRHERCVKHEVFHRHHYHGTRTTAYVKKQYWVREPTQVIHEVEKHVHLAKYHGKSESTDHLLSLQQAATKAAAAYRQQVDLVNAASEKRYAAFIRKVAAARQAAMKKREMRLVVVDKKIAEYKAKLEAGAQKRLMIRREIEAKKLAAIRAEYFRQLHAAEAAYQKSRVVEHFEKQLAAYRKKIMNKSDESAEFRAKLQKQILAKLSAYRKNLTVLEQAKLAKYKKAMTTSADALSKYTALYAAGRAVSKSRKAYWVKYAKQLGLDKVSYETTVVHHHHYPNHTVVVHHTHHHTIIIKGQRHVRVADKIAHKHLKVVTASHRPSFGSLHRVARVRAKVHKVTRVHIHRRARYAISHAKKLVRYAHIAIVRARAGKITKRAAQRAVYRAKVAVRRAHYRMVHVIRHTRSIRRYRRVVHSHRHLFRRIVRLNARSHSHVTRSMAQTAATNYQKALAKLSNMEQNEKA